MRIHLLFLVSVLLLPLTSCHKELSITDDYQPRMVLSGVLVPGREVTVHLGANYPSADSAVVKPITSATVELYSGNELLGIMVHTADGIYTLAASVVEGGHYTLKAFCEGYSPIESSTTIPFKHELIAVRYIHNGPYHETQNDTRQRLNIYISAFDNKSYYGFLLYARVSWDTSSVSEISKFVPYYSLYRCYPDEDAIEFYGIDYLSSGYTFSDFTHISHKHTLYSYSPDDREPWYYGSTHYFSNELFVGRALRVVANNLGTYSDYEDLNRATHVNIYQLSPELYKAFRGIAAQESTKRGIFVTPLPAYNSIKGGLGYFGGCLVHTVELGDVTVWD